MATPATKLRPVRACRTPANRLNLDYEAEAAMFPALPAPIIDVHAHLGGRRAARLYRHAARLYGVGQTYSMTQLEEVPAIREILGSSVRFIAVPNYRDPDRRHHFTDGFLERIAAFHGLGARIVKFWSAPRIIDYADELGDPDFMRLDAPHRLESMSLAHELGMCFMTHIADPDTWFSTRYRDVSRYGTKANQYELLEELLDRFDGPWIAAHLGGWPENLEFLHGLLERHDNLYMDTSATKWMVRVLSRHWRDDLIALLRRFPGRILFGSDIVCTDEHLSLDGADNEMTCQASSVREAFDLYASRYWALRALLETRYVGESPIADPDLSQVDPQRYGPMDAPALVGKHLPDDLLRMLYRDAAHDLLEPLHAGA